MAKKMAVQKSEETRETEVNPEKMIVCREFMAEAENGTGGF